jgi:hypothetical protein
MIFKGNQLHKNALGTSRGFSTYKKKKLKESSY